MALAFQADVTKDSSLTDACFTFPLQAYTGSFQAGSHNMITGGQFSPFSMFIDDTVQSACHRLWLWIAKFLGGPFGV